MVLAGINSLSIGLVCFFPYQYLFYYWNKKFQLVRRWAKLETLVREGGQSIFTQSNGERKPYGQNLIASRLYQEVESSYVPAFLVYLQVPVGVTTTYFVCTSFRIVDKYRSLLIRTLTN